MRKLSKKIARVSTILIVAILLLTGCGSSNAIVGTWKDSTGQTMGFYKDGTVTSGGVLSATGKYSFPDSTHLKIDLQGLLSIAGPQIYEYKINGNQLVLTNNLGANMELTRSTD